MLLVWTLRLMQAVLAATKPTAWTTWFEYHDTEPIKWPPRKEGR